MIARGDLLQLLSSGVTRLLSFVPLGLYHLLLSLVGEDQQRAEFRADLLASEVAGSAATASSLDHLHLADALETALHRQRHQPERLHAFLELRHIWATMPEARRQERRDEVAAQRTRLDATHPPTADRIAVVKAHPKPPRVTLGAGQAIRLEAELNPLVPPIERAAYKAYQARYTG